MLRRRRLGINIDHVATLRQTRRTLYPDPVAAAQLVEMAGADQITVHLREDRRHIQERDARVLRQTVQTALNLEMAAAPDMLKAAFDIKPDQVTLVAERRDERTTECGIDVVHHRDHLRKYVHNLREADIPVALCVDPDLEQIRAAHRLDAKAVELHTGKYSDARGEREIRGELQRIVDAARSAHKLGLRVVAGQGLHYQNIRALVPVEEIEGYNVGHSVICRAVLTGLDRAVRDMLTLLTVP